ncbi:LysR family transcriptional regulator [Rhizobium ruizarguesonis]|jgi:DNA-binding transcriptional LysR family regulator|uniref:HTH-type transcriptional regulator TtuA n=1 Tax=Rhizobium ruizarguesonis TaxID=2081791 RepID=A0AAE4YS56_9HYPH|nr:LysR family transcriptional regulator [Rhizobium ruizarguesonis]MBY5832226.1 LysR family transcriptional regulator [Rhizobium leguminosarum]NKJ76825.1 LysR family transcriptional regulator [Rhizobium leguminosarum bv. viciae]QJS26642.1 LysR family transcriptional regulator [Rhizobium leguminosarum bv. trifolii TA1]MBY5860919.1 LysR family transcriptional regulator [Rhizobium leguminosarum]MBY5875304.1 LysR family transcriptional regulator [Rhizobium leguminosarum]
METLANLESFVRSAELGSFSSAARRLGLTPAAVSRNVGALEGNLKLRLFQRSTRSLTLTEAGERFLLSIRDHLDSLQGAISEASNEQSEPSGVLKLSMSPTLGIGYILPLLPEFMQRYPMIRPEWMFENRQVDLIAEGYDAAIGGGFELTPGIIARALAPAHIIPVASPGYMGDRVRPHDPSGLRELDGIVMRSMRTGRIHQRQMCNLAGDEQPAALKETIIVNDPAAMRSAALLGLGVAMIAKADALGYLESGELIRLIPAWYADAGPISIYYANRTLLPSKTRVFIDFLTEVFQRERWPERFAGTLG